MSSTRSLLKILIPAALGIGVAAYGAYQLSKEIDPKVPVLKDPDEEKSFLSRGKADSITPRNFRIEDNATYLSGYKKMSLALVRAFYQLIPDGHKNFPSIFSPGKMFFNDYIMMVKINRLHKAFKELGIESDENQLMLINIFLVNGIQYPFQETKSEYSDGYEKTMWASIDGNPLIWNSITTSKILDLVNEDRIPSPTSNNIVRAWVDQTLERLFKNTKKDYESLPEKTKVTLKQALLQGSQCKDALTFEEYNNVIQSLYDQAILKKTENSLEMSESYIPQKVSTAPGFR